MIYVTVGNHDQPFDMLIKAMDDLAPEYDGMVMQIGCCNYLPKNSVWSRYYPMVEAERLINAAELVVAHAGIGTMITARKAGAPILISPRRKLRGEHFNDHQLEISEELLARPRPLVTVCTNIDELGVKVRQALAGRKTASGTTTGAGAIKQAIVEFLDACGRR
ncbi:MAG: hypothetical protein HY280_09935 [Nitrospinae bacterium]|nr:hypothetical protein [Nitrospinota bacterium]